MTTSFRVLLSIVALLTSAGIARADAEADIRKAGEAFAKAMRDGDFKAAKEHAMTDEQTGPLLDAMVKISGARTKLVDAAVAKFGDDGKSVFPQGRGQASLAPPIDHDFKDAKVNVEGDTATVAMPHGGPPVRFKKMDGAWKVDMTKLPNTAGIGRTLPLMNKMADVINETAGEIKEGKYPTAQEAKVALGQKMRAAVGTGGPRGGAGGRPGGTE